MKRRCVAAVFAGLVVLLASSLGGDEAPAKQMPPELREARRTRWQMATLIIENLKEGDLKNYPGIQAWLNDFARAAKGVDPKAAPALGAVLDVDALTTRNPNFWQAFYEIAPGDPGLVLLQGGLLLHAGEAVRASHLLLVSKQRPGIPKELQQGFDVLLAHCQKTGEESDRLVDEGIKLHDKENYAGALQKYQEARVVWPQNGFAHYEMGLTFYHQQVIAAGGKPPPAGTLVVNKGPKPSAAVKEAYAKARRHDPFQLKAYQGDDQEVIRGFLALAKQGLPAWQKVVRKGGGPVDNDVLEQLAAACQEAGNHELALVTRQVMVARRKRYAPADHPFITASLRKLVPGKQTEKVLQRLAAGRLELRQLVTPEDPKP
jgi:hypothetical protein